MPYICDFRIRSCCFGSSILQHSS